jgi:hypothetical protein
MIANLEPLEIVFYKVQLDLQLSAQKTDNQAFTEWAMEAIEYIGALNRLPSNRAVTTRLGNADDRATIAFEMKDHVVRLPHSVVSIGQVRYYKTDAKDRDDYEVATPVYGQALDDSDDTVKFDYIHNIDKNSTGISIGVVLNRKEGTVACGGLKLPEYYDTTGESIGIFIPALASYKDAIYWYITMKLLWQEVFRGKNKEHQLTYAAGMWNNLKNKAYAELMMPDNYELMRLAQELSLGVSYTGLNRRTSKAGIPMDLPMYVEGTDKTPPKPLIPNPHPPTPPWPNPPIVP